MGKIIWRLPVVMARTGLKRSTLYTKIQDGTFPPPINIGLRAVGWVDEEINSWIQSCIDASRSGDSE